MACRISKVYILFPQSYQREIRQTGVNIQTFVKLRIYFSQKGNFRSNCLWFLVAFISIQLQSEAKNLFLFPWYYPAIDVLINHHQSWWCTLHGNLFPLKIRCCFCFVKAVVPLPLLSQPDWYRHDSSRRENPAVCIQYMDKILPFTLMVIAGSRGRLSPAELSWYPVVFCTPTAWGIHCALTGTSSKKRKFYLLVLFSALFDCILSSGTSVVLFYPLPFAHLTALWSWKIALFRSEGF